MLEAVVAGIAAGDDVNARDGKERDSLLPQLALAFAMGTHPRLGSADETAVAGADTTNCAYASMPAELVQRVVEACVLWPEGRTGDLEGVVRLLGGGMTKARVST